MNPARTLLFTAAAIATAALHATAAAEEQDPAADVDLKFPKEVTEAPDVFCAAQKQPLVAELDIRKAALAITYNAAEKPFEHRQAAPARVDGAHAAEALKGRSNTIMLWGPYGKLKAGDYLVVYRFQLTGADKPKGTVFLDVAHNACTRSGIHLNAADIPAGEWQTIAVPVTVTEKMPLEFRFWPGGNEVAIDRVYLFRIAAAADPNDDKKLEGLPFGEPVAGRAGVVTSPHTDEKGMIDISGIKKGARVLCPYTGKYFRVP